MSDANIAEIMKKRVSQINNTSQSFYLNERKNSS